MFERSHLARAPNGIEPTRFWPNEAKQRGALERGWA
jgi:hypothetical protein